MQSAVIAYRNGTLEAREQDDVWTVRLANLETRASYLDLALAELLGNAPEAHRAAARLLSELEEVVERQETVYARVAPARPRVRQWARRHQVWSTPKLLGLRALVLSAVVVSAFILTTWLTALR